MSQQHLSLELKPEIEASLTAIPSATTLTERKMAMHFAATFWDGRGDVFENGPLLGAVTRALAIGMQSHENPHPHATLRTYDWWNALEPLDVPPNTFETMRAGGGDLARAVDDMERTGSFRPVFLALMEDGDYRDLVRDEVGYLPDHRGQMACDDAVTFSLLDQDQPFSLAFVDGCKSWYGTKYWAREIAPHLPVGGIVMFQDHGQYTCFWISALAALLSPFLKLKGYVDHTYAFEVTTEFDGSVIDAVFPDEPGELSVTEYEDLYGAVIAQAAERGDRFGVAAANCHLAAAMAYVGRPDEARSRIDHLLSIYEFFPLRPYLKAARHSPTYTPEGKIFL